MFQDRMDAGKQLGKALKKYKDENVIVLSIPRGGAEIGYWVAKALKASHHALVIRKLPLPSNPEAGFGAIAEDGSTYMQEGYEQWLSKEEIKRIKTEQQEEINKRIKKIKGGKSLPSLEDKTVVLVDDGIAMGSTMIAGIKACKNLGASKVIIGSPVASKSVAEEISKRVDELIVLEQPSPFYAVAQVYTNWHDVTYTEAKEFMQKKTG